MKREEEFQSMTAEAYGRRHFTLSVRRSGLVWIVTAVPTAVVLSVVGGVDARWMLLCLTAVYALGASIGLDTGRRGVDGGLSSGRRGFVWLLSRGDMRGCLALVLFLAAVWWGYEVFHSVIGLQALMETWPRMAALDDEHLKHAALAGFMADYSEVRETVTILGALVAALGLSGLFWSGALDGVWLGSASARMGVSWRQLLLERRAWREWARSRDERRWTYLGGAG